MTDRDTINRGGVLAVAGVTAPVSASVTRPEDTTQYAAGDVVGASPAAMMTFADMARVLGGYGTIIAARVLDSANQATKPDLELWLFNDDPAAPEADNAPFTPTDTDLTGKLIGVIPFGTTYIGDATSGAGGNCVHMPSDLIAVLFRCIATSKDLKGILVERGTYTPVSAEVFTVVLDVLQG